jgi:peptidoglycan/LPS O-acetylase OafA/YrhL
MRKRARRLLPPYWVALAASVLMLVLAPHGVRAGAGSFSKGPVPAHSVVAFTLLLQDVFSRFPSPNSPMWSIAVEWHLYFVFPLLLALGARFGMRKMVVGAAVVGVTLHYVLRPTAAIGTAPHFLAMFAAGIAAAYLVRERPLRRVTGPAAARLGWAFIALAWLTFGALAHWEMGADLLVGLLVATALWILASQPPPVPTGRLGRSLVAVGLVSYSLYLVHSPIEKVLWTLVVSKLGLGQVASLVVLSLSGISVALLAAWVMFRLVEQPSMRWSARAGRSPVGAGSPLDPREGSNR